MTAAMVLALAAIVAAAPAQGGRTPPRRPPREAVCSVELPSARLSPAPAFARTVGEPP